MSQDITNSLFPTDKIKVLYENINSDIKEILSNSSQRNDLEERISSLIIELEEVIKLLFESILVGEYLRNENIVNNIEQLKNNLFSSEDFENKKINVGKIIKPLLEDIRKKGYLIENLLEEYIRFINNFKFYVNKDKDYIFSPTQNIKSIQEKEHNLFLVNLYLCIYDVQLNEHHKYVYDMEGLKSYIDTGGYLAGQKEKMLKKANFLLFKWYKRAEIDKKNISSVIDGEEKDDYENEISGYGEEWKKIVEYINNHYFEGKERELKKSFQKIKDKNKDNYSYQDIHLYIKYYKDIKKDLNKLDDIIKFIRTKDDIIYQDILQYAINNRFSLFLEKSSDKSKIYEEYQKTKRDSKNYFPQYKFVEKILSIINADLQRENISLEEIKEIESFIKKNLDTEYNKYKANMEWFAQHSNFIYRVPYNECMIDDIFIYSSFVLPAPNKEVRDKYEVINFNYQALKTQIEPLKKVSSLLLDVSKNRVQIIELMGIFLAVIAFVMSSVSSFQFITNIWSAVLFLVIFSTGLISFLLVLLLITRHNENIFKKYWKALLFFYVTMGSSIYCISNKLENDKPKVEDQVRENKQNNVIEKSSVDTSLKTKEKKTK